jgi:hypothetical protein
VATRRAHTSALNAQFRGVASPLDLSVSSLGVWLVSEVAFSSIVNSGGRVL